MADDPNGEAAGIAFLEANRAKPGVVSLPTGLQYKVLVEGAWDDEWLEKEKNEPDPGPCGDGMRALLRGEVVEDVEEEEVVPEALLAPATGKENAGLGPRAVTMETGAPVAPPSEGLGERTVTLDERADPVEQRPPPVTPVTQDDAAPPPAAPSWFPPVEVTHDEDAPMPPATMTTPAHAAASSHKTASSVGSRTRFK